MRPAPLVSRARTSGMLNYAQNTSAHRLFEQLEAGLRAQFVRTVTKNVNLANCCPIPHHLVSVCSGIKQ
jgi:hypothetical protein